MELGPSKRQSMRPIVSFIESFQKAIDLEKIEFLGIALDRYAHFGIIFFIALAIFYFKRPKVALAASIFLILGKEILDLSVILYYEPISQAQYIDSGYDLVAGALGLLSAVIIKNKLAE